MTSTHSFLSRAFQRHGAALAARPLLFIVPAVLIVAGLSGGLALVTVEDNPDAVWVPPTSQTAQQKAFFDVAFDPFFRINQLIVTYNDACTASAGPSGIGGYTPSPTSSYFTEGSGSIGGGAASWSGSTRLLSPDGVRTRVNPLSWGATGGGYHHPLYSTPHARMDTRSAAGGAGAVVAYGDDDSCPTDAVSPASGILTRRNLELLLTLQQAISDAVDSAGTSLSDICYRPIAGKGCLIQTPLDYFRSDAALVATLTPAMIQEAMECRAIVDLQSTTPCVNAIGGCYFLLYTK